MKSKRTITRIVVLLLLLPVLPTCQPAGRPVVLADYEVPLRWADMALYITRYTPANSPTFASRGFGYLGLALYESVVPGFSQKQSLAGQLNGLAGLPVPEPGKKYNWFLSLNAGQAALLKSIYRQTSDENKAKIDSLEAALYDHYATGEPDQAVVARSVQFGRAVAGAVFEWSKTDGGHRGYLRNFDPHLRYPAGPGAWRAPFFSQTISRFPLHPHWGNNRTFLAADQHWPMPACIPYDTAAGSAYAAQFREVYEANRGLTSAQRKIALWWNDDPGDTFTPPGHSYNLASIVVRTQKPDLVTAAETYARVGMAVADAFIVCWKMKYHFFSERPSGFISEHFDDAWQPFWPDPPFPAFPSGHATQAAAVAVVMGGLYGDNTPFVDDTHAGRPRDRMYDVAYKPRKYQSFWQAAEETAYSRFLGGIHTRQDNQVGLAEGAKVGGHINGLAWNRVITATLP